MHSDYDGITHDYTRKTGVVHSEIMLPEYAPKEYADRSKLWNAVEKAEKRTDSQTAREINIALPVELNRKEQIQLVRDYIQENFVDNGMCSDFALHDKRDGNPHVHIMLTTREVSEEGFGNKNRDWNKIECLEQWRENWAIACNEKLKVKGIDKQIDHRTLSMQGIDREPTIHEGRNPERIQENKEIIARNETIIHENTAKYIHELKQGYIILDKEISAIKQQTTESQRKIQSLKFRAEEIEERAENINAMKERLLELRAERQSTGFFDNKKAIDTQIQRIENSLEQAERAFKREYYVFPDESVAEIRRLEYKARDLEQSSQRIQERIDPLSAEKDIFMHEYQKNKLITEISPNGQIIQDELAQLDKKALQELTTQEKITRLRSGRMLDIVTERNFQKVLDEVSPEQAYKLIHLRERERAKEHKRDR